MRKPGGTMSQTDLDGAVRVEADGAVRILTMNRPDTLNAFDRGLHAALLRALREVGADSKARAVVLTGAGKAFSAGGNIEEFETYANDLELRRASLREARHLFEDLINLRAKPYLLTGDRMTAGVAVSLGLATRAVPPGDVLPEAIAMAQKIAALPPQAVQDTKMVLNQHLRQTSVAVLGYGPAAESQSHDTAEYRAAPEKFRSRKG
jgi:enoyl-CoA hydratase